MPLQHASDNVLQLMRRGTTKEKTQKLIDKVRSIVPDVALRTTMIIGHPGETKEDFEELKTFVGLNRFDRLGVFTYSHEEGTHAYTFKDSVPEKEKHARANELMQIQEHISFEMNQEKIGKIFKTIIDKKEGGYYIGRTEYDSPEVDNEVLISAKDHYLRVGDFAQIKIVQATEFDLHGEPV